MGAQPDLNQKNDIEYADYLNPALFLAEWKVLLMLNTGAVIMNILEVSDKTPLSLNEITVRYLLLKTKLQMEEVDLQLTNKHLTSSTIKRILEVFLYRGFARYENGWKSEPEGLWWMYDRLREALVTNQPSTALRDFLDWVFAFSGRHPGDPARLLEMAGALTQSFMPSLTLLSPRNQSVMTKCGR